MDHILLGLSVCKQEMVSGYEWWLEKHFRLRVVAFGGFLIMKICSLCSCFPELRGLYVFICSNERTVAGGTAVGTTACGTFAHPLVYVMLEATVSSAKHSVYLVCIFVYIFHQEELTCCLANCLKY